MLKTFCATSTDKPRVTLRTVADKVGLAPCSISAVLNNSPAAQSIPQRTKDRVLRAARQLNYRPNLAARALRTRRTSTVALLATDLGSAMVARVAAGVERLLAAKGYCLLVAACARTPELSELQAARLLQRGIDGIIAIDSPPPQALILPMVFIDLPAMFLLPVSPVTRHQLMAVGDSAAKALLAQIEQNSALLIRIALTPESVDGHWQLKTLGKIEQTGASTLAP
jgi:DNA-binding LacI/PurR family transcriptional regulator